MRINICTAVNSKYIRYLCVMLASLFENNKQSDVTVYILQSDLTDEDRMTLKDFAYRYGQTIVTINIDRQRFLVHLPTTDKFSLETYFRLLLVEELTDLDKLLYLDVDILIRGDLRPLYSLELGQSYAAVCKDMLMPYLTIEYQKRYHRFGDIPYFNAGVMVLNLPVIRAAFTFADFMNAAKELRFDLPDVDQDILNYLMADNVLWMDEYRYNYMPLAVLRDHPEWDQKTDATVVHFAARNPWAIGAKAEIYREWWDYAKATPFYTELLEDHVKRVEEYAYKERANDTQKEELARVQEALFEETMACTLVNRLQKKKARIAIYGTGYLAEKLYKLLKYEGVEDNIDAVVDCYKSGRFHGTEICNSVGELYGKWVIIVTPSYQTQEILKDLSSKTTEDVRVISVLKFLQGADV